MDRCTILLPQPPVGYWVVGKGKPGEMFYTYRIAQQTRPRWLTRLMARWLLELEWEDAP